MPQGPNKPYTALDQNQIVQRTFDEVNDRLRVDAKVTAVLGTVECVISAASGDNIAITDQTGTNKLNVNTNGSIDVNGVSTSAKQDVSNSSLSSIDSKLPSNLTTTANKLLVDNSGVIQPVSGTITANQGGIWNINNISGIVSLPTNAATSALQTPGNSSLSSIDGKLNSLGQKTMVGSAPVVLSSDQSAIPVSQSGTWSVNNISGTVSLPTGAATSSLQTIANTSLSSIDGKLTNNFGIASAALRTAAQLGNATGSVDFNAGTSSAQTIRNSSNITRNGTELSYNAGISDANTLRTATNLYDSSGNAITSTLINSKQRLDINNPSDGSSGSAVPFSTSMIGGSDGTNLRSLKMSTSGVPYCTISSPGSLPAGVYANVSIGGALSTSTDPVNLFSDAFDGMTLDITNRWNSPIVAGAGAVNQTGGNLSFTVGTGANSAAQVSTQPLFLTSTASQIPFGIGLKLETTIATGAHRFFGFGTQGTSYSTTNPIKDGIGFEITTTGILRAVVYSSDALLFSQNLTIPVDGITHTYVVITRGNFIFWYLDTFELPLASSTFQNPSSSTLPIRFHILNGSSTTVGTPIMTLAAIGAVDQGRNAQSISDGTYPWRKTLVDKLGNLSITSMAPTLNYYSAPINIRQSAATAANATVWTMRNPAASTKVIYIERIYLMMDFDSGAPLGRSLQRYDLERFTTATPTGGTAITVATMDTSNAATAVTDLRFLDTGLTTTSIVFSAPFVTIGCPASDGSVVTYVRENIGFKLAAGEGLAIRLNVAAVIGQGLTGEITWSER